MAPHTSCISTNSFYSKRNKLNGGNSASLSALNNSFNQSTNRDETREKKLSNFYTPRKNKNHFSDRQSPYSRSPIKNKFEPTRSMINFYTNSSLKKRKLGKLFTDDNNRHYKNEPKEMKKSRSNSEEDYRKQNSPSDTNNKNESSQYTNSNFNRGLFNSSNNNSEDVENILLSHNNEKVLYRNKSVTLDEVRNEDKENAIDSKKHSDLLETNTIYLNSANKLNRLDSNNLDHHNNRIDSYSLNQANYYENYSPNMNYQNRVKTNEEDKQYNLHQSTSSSQNKDSLFPVALRNLGNTCYMNSIVQTLFNLPFLMCELRDSFERADLINKELNFSMTKSLVELFEEYKRMRKTQSTNDELERRLCAFKYNVGLHSAEFKSSGQHDAVEFLDSVINSIDDEFDKVKKVIPNCKNPVNKVFKIELGEASHCEACNLKSNIIRSKSHCLILSLPEEKYMEENNDWNLQQILRNYFKPEKRESKCEKCGNKERNRYLTVIRSPRVLILQLGRYSATGGKRHEPIKVPFEITLPKVHSREGRSTETTSSKIEQQNQNNNAFELSGVICHHGSCLAGGHYICYIHDRLNNEWYHCDDENIMQTSFERVQEGSKSSGYCFFYLNRKYV